MSCLFLAALWSPAGKGWYFDCSMCCVFLCCATIPNVFWSTAESRVRFAPWNWFKPSTKIFYWPFQGGTFLWIFYVFFSVLCLLCLYARLFICTLWSPVGKGLTSWLSFVVFDCEFVTCPLVSWVRCGTWLHRFLIFAPLLTLRQKKISIKRMEELRSQGAHCQCIFIVFEYVNH